MNYLQNSFIVKGYKNNLHVNLNSNAFFLHRNGKKHQNFNTFIGDENFLKKDINFSFPSYISNSIINITNENQLDRYDKFNFVLKSIEQLCCKNLLIIFSIDNNLFKITDLISSINNYKISEVTLLFNFSKDLYSDEFEKVLLKIIDKIKYVIIYNSPFNKNLEDIVHYVKFSRDQKNKKSESEFYINNIMYSESLNASTYFNRKLTIGTKGEIKNAPECSESYGNINEINTQEELKQIISSIGFQKYWFVKKVNTDVCKDCEYRHMCIDDRIPYERSQNEWFHKIECNYNPYIGKWESEEGYQTLAQCGVISNENGFKINHKKIAKINAIFLDEEEIDIK